MPFYKKKKTVRATFALAPSLSKHSAPHTPPKPSPKWLTPRRIAAIFQINSARKVMEENERLKKLKENLAAVKAGRVRAKEEKIIEEEKFNSDIAVLDAALLTPLSEKKSPALEPALALALEPAKKPSAKKPSAKKLNNVRQMVQNYETARNPPPKRPTNKPLTKVGTQKKHRIGEEGFPGIMEWSMGGGRHKRTRSKKTRKTRKTRKY